MTLGEWQQKYWREKEQWVVVGLVKRWFGLQVGQPCAASRGIQQIVLQKSGF